MKKLLILIFTLSILLSCDQKKSNKKESKPESKTDIKTPDTTVVYWQTDFDTIRNNQEVRIGNDLHQLELKTYSLNDSSIVAVNGNYKGIYHDYVSQIILTKQKDTILNRKLTKKAFKDSLNTEFYKLCVLTEIEYDGIRSNRLFFKGSLNVPDTDWVIGNDFGVFYQTKKKNQIDSWDYEDIGL
ncbi:DUF4738 domain-containing protein [Flavivirga eckloniae]|uniref:Lipoprotein n=1 Tax=Flavivirga eckloniae TaxID=1803846 RepID=A0A2K9PQX1_9FLAO|nr:DUF4738 domain-containing protein [Flavivirga eckloniae]AUP79218.1 hypothetical protein C1H87_11090 [Flavivirga eckloniae]